VEAECKEEVDEERQGTGVLRLSCYTPNFVLSPLEGEEGEEESKEAEEEKGTDEEEGKDNGEEEGEEEEEKGADEEEGDEGEDGEVVAPPPTKKAEISKVFCMVASNGANFGNVCGTFNYYPTPSVSKLSVETVKAGSTLVLEGEGFFSSKVWVKFDNECGVESVVEGKFGTRGEVTVVVPELIEETVYAEEAGEEGEEKKEGEEVQEKGGKVGEEGAEEERKDYRFAVSVSFNGTNFSSVGEAGCSVLWDEKVVAAEEEEDEA